MRKARGFTLIEMMVVVLIIIILIGIGLAVGEQVQAGSKLALTKSELKGLQGSLQWYEHKTAGQVPTDMLSFLEGYQRLHAYKTSGGIWAQHKNFLTNLPSSAVVTGMFPGPGAGTTQNMNGVIEILDGLGNPIQYVPETVPISNTVVWYATAYPYPQSGGSYNFTVWNNQPLVYISALTYSPTSSEMPFPSQVHAPCFFSFGTNYNGTTPTEMNYESYIYSYNP